MTNIKNSKKKKSNITKKDHEKNYHKTPLFPFSSFFNKPQPPKNNSNTNLIICKTTSSCNNSFFKIKHSK